MATTSGSGGRTAAGSTPRAFTTRSSPSPASSIARWAARRSSSFRLRPGVHVTPVLDYSQYDWTSPGSRRRSVYRFLFRTLPDPFFDAFDSADASQLTAVRNESTTPLQALELLNNPFVLRQCEAFAGNLAQVHCRCSMSKSRAAIELAYGRQAAADEIELLSAYASRHGLVNLCRLILNSNEFLYVN